MLLANRWWILMAALALTVPPAIGADELNRFNYGEIPFGDPVSAVLKTVDGAYINKQSDPRILAVFNYHGVFGYFRGGIYEKLGRPGYLQGAVVTYYTVRADEWDGEIEVINLYFMARHDSDDEPMLFMVHKRLEDMHTKGAYSTVVSAVRESISSAIGSGPATNVRTVHESLTLGRTDANMTSWETDDLQVLLLSSVNPFSRSIVDNFDFVYIHKGLWQDYIDADNEYRAYLEQRDHEAASESADNF